MFVLLVMQEVCISPPGLTIHVGKLETAQSFGLEAQHSTAKHSRVTTEPQNPIGTLLRRAALQCEYLYQLVRVIMMYSEARKSMKWKKE